MTRNAARVRFQVESLEGRLPLSALAHAAPATPVVVDLTPQQTDITVTAAGVDPRIGVVTIRGTATCTVSPFFPGPFPPFFPPPSGPFPLAISVNVTQPVTRLQSVNGFGSASAVCNAPGQQVPFTVRLTASNGRFGRGLATLSLFPSSGPFGPGGSEMVVVRLRPARLS
jgi:hypothetical protein